MSLINKAANYTIPTEFGIGAASEHSAKFVLKNDVVLNCCCCKLLLLQKM